jgi:uncharacterized protein
MHLCGIMLILGYIASILIGVSLGLIGGGGSILTVPVLVYLLDVEPVLATAYSLFVVGTTSLVGGVQKWREQQVDLRTALIFGLPSILAVYATRSWVVPMIPQKIIQIGGNTLTKPTLLMGLFAILMVAAAISMIRDRHGAHGADTDTQAATKHSYNYPLIIVEGLVVGGLTGLVGAGGGFLIIPALVMLSKLPMKQAVGTSLIIIAAKSLFGFLGDLSHYSMDWALLGTVTGLAIIGIFAGNALSRRIQSTQLKRAFGWFVLVMGAYILAKEFIR